MPQDVPRLWLLAGPNGAGKSTFARGYFQSLAARGLLLNADEVAREIDPSNPSGSALAVLADSLPNAVARKSGGGMVVMDPIAGKALRAAQRQ